MADPHCLACGGRGEVCECIDDFDHGSTPANWRTHEFAGMCVCGCSKGGYSGMPCPVCEPEKLAAMNTEAEHGR